ncbi:hypothetical protein [Flexivirga oryzae]|uniref:Uncharacterized protein n=1 Tax=Flexivirga oryzae TaxID=1794944 RepID=A0A839NJN3_9MICO|nr:hypothetical protein [Flexivirga oryzae]MBB2894562.1 hypothetical protein [Flexivirga oryzae]
MYELEGAPTKENPVEMECSVQSRLLSLIGQEVPAGDYRDHIGPIVRVTDNGDVQLLAE